MSVVHVIATMVAQEGKADELRSLLEGLLGPTHVEAGCERYELYQNVEDEREFRFVEEWTSAEALAAHFETPHIKDAFDRAPALLAGELDVRTYRALG